MNSLHRMVTKQLNDLTQKRQSTQLKSTLSYSDDFSLVDEPVSQQQPIGTQVFYPATNTRPIKKLTNTLKNTFRHQRESIKSGNDDEEYTLKSKTTMLGKKIRNVKESTSQIPIDLIKIYKQAKIIDVRNGKLVRTTNNAGDNQNLLLSEELDNSAQH